MSRSPGPAVLPARLAAPDQALPDAQLAFLARVAHHGIIGRAQVETQTHPRDLREWRADPAFAEALQAAQDLAADYLEGVAWDRAVVGTTVPVYGAHGKVGEKVERDHQLLVLLLKARKPGHFRDRPTAAPLPDAAARKAEYEAQLTRLRLRGQAQARDQARGEREAQAQAQARSPHVSQPPPASASPEAAASYEERPAAGGGEPAPPPAPPAPPATGSSPSSSQD